MLTSDDFLSLKDDVKFQLYKAGQEEIKYLRTIVANLSNNIQMQNEQNEEQHGQIAPTNGTVNSNFSKFSDVNQTADNKHQRPAGPNNLQIQTRGISNRATINGNVNPLNSAQQENRPQHLALPKEGNVEALVIGDSITNRINGHQIGEAVIARGFGGHTVKSLLERTANTRPRKVKQVNIFIGVNDCLSDNFDVKEVAGHYEKLIYTVSHKFSPENINLCTITPLGAFRKDLNSNVTKMNNKIKSFATGIKDLTNVKLTITDIYQIFTQNSGLLSTDGLHPSEKGVTALVNAFREVLQDNGLEAANCEITVRPKITRDNRPNQQQEIVHYFRKGLEFFANYK